MSRRLAVSILLSLLAAVLLLPCGSTHAVADDKEKEEGLVTRLFDVAALTSGRTDFWRPLSMSAEGLDYDEAPLFGGEAEEPHYPVGQIDELIELIKRHVRPDSWESTLGAEIRSIGEQTLVVRSYGEVVDTVATYLGALQRRLMRRVCVDVESFRLTASEMRGLLIEGSAALADSAKVEALRGGAKAGPSVSITAYERHRAAIFSGTQRAFVGDYDVEVAWGAKISDPIVYVDNTGLSADMRATLGPDGKSALVMIDAALSRLEKTDTVDTGEGRLVELPQHDIALVQSRIEVPVGRWALLEGQSTESGRGWFFAVRVTALPLDDLAEAARGVTLVAPSPRATRTNELRTYDIAMLGQAVYSRLGTSINLVPSNFSPPEPPELPEPAPIMPAETIVELLRDSIVPASWELRGTFIDARIGHLYVRNAPYILDAIGAQLTTIRREFIWSTVTTAEVVDVTDALGRRLQAAPSRVLDAAGLAALDAAVAAKEARRLGTTRVATMRGGRNAVTTGRRIAYVGDFEVELAGESTVSNPVIERCLSGSELDVQPLLTPGGQAAETTLRYVRTEVGLPLRKMKTPHGEIGVPAMDTFRLRAALQVPLGKTMIVGSAGSEGRRQLLLVTTRLRRAAR